MTTKQTVTCVGELIVDFISTNAGVTLEEADSFRRCAGGAPANVAVGLARLGVQSAFAGKTGNDAFGKFLIKELQRARVDTNGIVLDAKHKTRLAFVALHKSGEREFEFWEKHPADIHLGRSDIDRAKIGKSAIVHVSSFLLLKEPSRSTAFALAQYCSRSGSSVSFDPNLRLPLWDSQAEARRMLMKMVQFAKILRLNAEEAYFLTGKRNLEAAARSLRSIGPSMIVITRGDKGCYLQAGAAAVFVDGFTVRTVDTTGCGDAFLAGLLSALVESPRKPEEMNELELKTIGRFANAVGALTAMKYGAIPALPKLSDVQKFLKVHR